MLSHRFMASQDSRWLQKSTVFLCACFVRLCSNSIFSKKLFGCSVCSQGFWYACAQISLLREYLSLTTFFGHCTEMFFLRNTLSSFVLICDDMSSPHGADADRLCLHNLSFGVSRATIVKELVNCGFAYMREDDVNIVRKGMGHDQKLCTAFVTMANSADVELCIQLLHGRVVPSCSWKSLRAEKALPRLNTLKRSYETSSSAAPKLPTPTEGEAAVHHLMQGKREESQLENAYLKQLQVYKEEPLPRQKKGKTDKKDKKDKKKIKDKCVSRSHEDPDF